MHNLQVQQYNMCPNSQPITNYAAFAVGVWTGMALTGRGLTGTPFEIWRVCVGWGGGCLLRAIDSWGPLCIAGSIPLPLQFTLMPFSDQIKAQTPSAQRLGTSVLKKKHSVHPPQVELGWSLCSSSPRVDNICRDGLVHINYWSMSPH